MPPPRKKRPPAGQPVPDAGTISAHRDAPRRSSGAAGQKPPGRGRKNSPGRGLGTVCRLRPWGNSRQWGCLVPGRHRTWLLPGQGAYPSTKTAPGGRRRLSGCGIWVLLAPGDPCDLDAQGGQHSQAEDHAQLSQGEICHQEQAMQSGDQQHSQEQQHAHAEGSQ